jgi:hypothetical protein
MTTFTFNTESKGLQKLQIDLINFVHSINMSVEEFAFGKENELNVNGKLFQFNVLFNGFDFCDEYSVISLEKSISFFK